jgi:hypothetical protein
MTNININSPLTAVPAIITGLNNDFSINSIESSLLPLFAGIDPTNIVKSSVINAICGPLLAQLNRNLSISEDDVVTIMEYLFATLAAGASQALTLINVATFFAQFCKFYRPGCVCFEYVVLKALCDLGFNINPKSKEGLQNVGIALGIYARITGIRLAQCIRTYIQLKGDLLAYAFKSYLELQSADFFIPCEYYSKTEIKIKRIGCILKEIIGQCALKNAIDSLAHIYCDLMNAWKCDGFLFCAKNVADFLVMYSKLDRRECEELKMKIYRCLEVPAVRNVYLKIEDCVEMDLAKFVENDNTTFKYTVDSCDTKGTIQLSSYHPPAPPLIRYRIPECACNASVFKDVFSFTVTNLANGYESTACVFLLYTAY